MPCLPVLFSDVLQHLSYKHFWNKLCWHQCLVCLFKLIHLSLLNLHKMWQTSCLLHNCSFTEMCHCTVILILTQNVNIMKDKTYNAIIMTAFKKKQCMYVIWGIFRQTMLLLQLWWLSKESSISSCIPFVGTIMKHTQTKAR